MSRVRWGNVAQLAALVVAVGLIAFGVPDGCGSEPEVVPLDGLPGEPVTVEARMAAPRSHPSAPRPRRARAQPRPPRKRPVAKRVAKPVRPSVPAVRRPPSRRPERIPEAAREFSFDR